MMRFGLGIDVGGTFTDIVAYDAATGRQVSHKELTTHADPSRGVMAGIERLLAESDIAAGGHRARGARDDAVHQRPDRAQGRARPASSRPRASATRSRSGASASTSSTTSRSSSRRRWCRATCGWRCRSAWQLDGSVRAAARRGRRARRGGRGWRPRASASLAIVFLHSYANPRHERQAAGADRRTLSPTCACRPPIDVAPEIREYERVSTTVINAYIKPLAERYLSTLAAQARGARHRGAAAADAVERRPHQHRGGQAHAGAAAGIRDRRQARSSPRTSAPRWRRPRAGLRHGRHDRQAQRHRRRQAHRRLQLRGGARAPLHRGQRPAGAHLDPGADRDRRRRRLDRPPRRHRPAEGRARQRRLRAGPRRLWARRHSSRPSPTPTSCSAISIPPTSSAAPWRSTSRPPRRPCGPLAERAGLQHHGARLGHPRPRQREHGQCRARAHRRARQGPAALRAAGHRRRGARARLLRRQEARAAAPDRAAGGRRRLGARPADRAGPRRPGGDRRARAWTRSCGPTSRRPSRGWKPRPRPCWRRRCRIERRPPSRASPTSATSARPPSWSCRCRRALHGRLARRPDARPSRRATSRPSRARRRRPRSRSSTCASAPASTSKRSGAAFGGTARAAAHRRQGNAPGLLPRVPRVPADHGLRPLCARSPARPSTARPSSRSASRRWWSAPAAASRSQPAATSSSPSAEGEPAWRDIAQLRAQPALRRRHAGDPVAAHDLGGGRGGQGAAAHLVLDAGQRVRTISPAC